MTTKFDLDAIVQMNHLLQGLETVDQIGMVLRLHLQIEQSLEVYLKGMLTDEMLEVFKIPQNFAHKVMLASALGFPKELAIASLAMNSLRNKFAHEAGKTLTLEDVKLLEQKYEAARVVVDPTLYALQGSAIRVASLSEDKFEYGKAGPEWDLKMVGGALSGLMLRYLLSLNSHYAAIAVAAKEGAPDC